MGTISAFCPSNFMLVPTAACQASCTYCFGPNRGETMTREVADKALDFMERIAPEEGNVALHFTAASLCWPVWNFSNTYCQSCSNASGAGCAFP